MAVEEKGPEPTGWELMRGLDRVERSVQSLSQGVVSQTMFAVYQAAQAEERRSDRERIASLETELAEARKTKAQQWFAIGLALLGMVGTVVVTIILRSTA